MPPSTRKVDAGDERRVVAGQERHRGGQFLRLGEPAHRHVHQPARRALGILGEQLLQQRRVHRSRAQRVDPDALPRVLHAELARHRQHAALGGGVGDLRRRRAHHRDERRGVDDRALLRGHHVPQRGPAAQVHRLEVDVLHPLPGVAARWSRSSRRRAGDAGVVERDVDRAVGLGGGVEQRRRPRPGRRRRRGRTVRRVRRRRPCRWSGRCRR